MGHDRAFLFGDEYPLMIHPLVLGEGHRLFAAGKHTELRLIDTATTTTGVLIATYDAHL